MTRQELERAKQAVGTGPYDRKFHPRNGGGKDYTTKCPWHDDRHNSFSVFERNGEFLWKCHGSCNAGGDVIDFLVRLYGMSFREACKEIGVDLGVSDRPQQEQFLYDPTAATARLGEAAEYLRGRGIDLAIAEAAGVGVVDHPVIGRAVALHYGDGVAKFRSLTGKQFAQVKGRGSNDRLYGIDLLDDFIFELDPEVFVTESELDSLMLRSHGLTAISVSSAGCGPAEGELKIRQQDLDKLKKAERIFLVLDQDADGQRCAGAFERAFQRTAYRLTWTYSGKGSNDSKDIGEVYAQAPLQFRARLAELQQEALNRPPSWRRKFKTVGEMKDGDLPWLIEGFAPYGIGFLGGLPGCGKTWVAMSMAKSLTTGRRFVGCFPVPEIVPVLYLCPESGEQALRLRLNTLRISDNFFCRSAADGVMKLDDPDLLAAVRELKPVVMLDTVIRFSDAENENDAAQNRALANGLTGLIAAGARGVVGIHHSTKASRKKVEVTLEDTLRGSGDIAALCDFAYHVRCEDADRLAVAIRCVKPRDFEPPAPFLIEGRPYLEKQGAFAMIEAPGETAEDRDVARVSRAIEAKPTCNVQELASKLGISKNRIVALAQQDGWKKVGHEWKRVEIQRTLKVAAG